MAKTESTFISMVLTLFLVSAVSSAAVAYVYEITREPKAKSDLVKKIQAIQEVVPEFDNNPVNEQYTIKDAGQEWFCYPAKKNGKLVATAIEASTMKGYGGKIRLMAGFLPNGSIYNVAVLEHRETPGLGDKLEKSKSNFSKQFSGKDPKQFRLNVKKDGGDVDGITAATISSRAFCDAIRDAYQAFMKDGQR